MAENLNYETAAGSWCYDGNSKQCKKTGRLYDWETAKKVAPEGWVLPAKEDFEKMIDLLGGALNSYSKLIKGGKSGFNALYSGGKFDDVYTVTWILPFSFGHQPRIRKLLPGVWVWKGYGTSNLNNYNKTLGLSVRCIKNNGLLLLIGSCGNGNCLYLIHYHFQLISAYRKHSIQQ